MLFIAAAGFALTMALIKLAGERLHVTQILLVRQIVMALIVLPVLIKSFPDSFKTTRIKLHLLRVCVALVAMLCGFYAVIHMPLADVTAIGFAKAFFVTMFAIWLLKEKVGPRRWGAVLVGFIGVILMIRPGSDGFDPISLLALISSAAAGLVMVLLRILSRTEKPTTTLSYQAYLVGIVMIIPGYYFWLEPTLREWLLMLVIGVFSYGAQMLNIYAYKWGEASVLASLDYIRILYATMFGYFLFDSLPGPYTWAGALVIVAASIYTVHRERKQNRNLARSPEGRGYTST